MDELQDFGKIIVELIQFFYMYSAMIAAVSISLAVLIIQYIKKKKTTDENGDIPKKYVPLRISIIVVGGVLILLLAPMITAHFG